MTKLYTITNICIKKLFENIIGSMCDVMRTYRYTVLGVKKEDPVSEQNKVFALYL